MLGSSCSPCCSPCPQEGSFDSVEVSISAQDTYYSETGTYKLKTYSGTQAYSGTYYTTYFFPGSVYNGTYSLTQTPQGKYKYTWPATSKICGAPEHDWTLGAIPQPYIELSPIFSEDSSLSYFALNLVAMAFSQSGRGTAPSPESLGCGNTELHEYWTMNWPSQYPEISEFFRKGHADFQPYIHCVGGQINSPVPSRFYPWTSYPNAGFFLSEWTKQSSQQSNNVSTDANGNLYYDVSITSISVP